MKIYNLSPLNFNVYSNNRSNSHKAQNANSNVRFSNPINLNHLQYNDYLLNFTSRVDKGLERFYSENKDRMPKTLKDYIDLNIEDKSKVHPIEAAAAAFAGLYEAQDSEEVKILYFPDEPLFENLKDVKQTKATKGFLYDLRVMQDVLEEENQTILQSSEDLTVYLLKKIFVEAKPLSEINEDLDKDLNPVFQNDDKKYITYPILASLGIKLPAEYLISLRYTKEGYSDRIGGMIKNALRRHYDSLSPDEKNERSKISASNLEKYRENLTPEQKAELSKKMSEAQLKRWENLTPEQRVDLINAMQTGSDVQSLAMISAWNNCDEIREHLSQFFKSKNMFAPDRIIYRSENFSDYQRQIMIEFWKKHPEDSKKLGFEIQKAYQNISKAQQDGVFEQLRFEILAQQADKKRELKGKKSVSKKTAQPKGLDPEAVFTNFRKAFEVRYPFYPKDYAQTLMQYIKKNASSVQELVDFIYIINQKGDIFSTEKLKHAAFNELYCEDNSITQAMAEILFEASDKSFPNVFNLSSGSLAMMLSEDLENDSPYPHIIYTANIKNLESTENYAILSARDFGAFVLNSRPNIAKLEGLYRKYNKKPSSGLKSFVVELMQENLLPKNMYKDDPKFYSFASSYLNSTLNAFLNIYGSRLLYVQKHPNSEESKRILSGFRDEYMMYYRKTTTGEISDLAQEKNIGPQELNMVMNNARKHAIEKGSQSEGGN